jgi:hypothetical protein
MEKSQADFSPQRHKDTKKGKRDPQMTPISPI